MKSYMLKIIVLRMLLPGSNVTRLETAKLVIQHENLDDQRAFKRRSQMSEKRKLHKSCYLNLGKYNCTSFLSVSKLLVKGFNCTPFVSPGVSIVLSSAFSTPGLAIMLLISFNVVCSQS